MPIWSVDERAIDRPPEDFEATTSQTLRKAFEDAFAKNPTSMLSDLADSRARGEDADRVDSFLTKTQAEERAAAAGVKVSVPDIGMPDNALDVLINRRYEQNRRDVVLARSSKSLATGAGKLGAALVASVLDPLNVASAFIPVVGEARYARMLGTAGGAIGRVGVRSTVGALEGAVGAAVIEPAVYGLSQQLQDDYSFADSLMNIGFGTILGGGLHVGAGAAAEAFRNVRGISHPWDTLLPTERATHAVEQTLARNAVPAENLSEVTKGLDHNAFEELVRVADRRLAVSDIYPGVKIIASTPEQIKAGVVEDTLRMARERVLTDIPSTADREVIASAKKEIEYLRSQGAGAETDLKNIHTQDQAKAASGIHKLNDRVKELERVVESDKNASNAVNELQQIDKGVIPERFQPLLQENLAIAEGRQKIQQAFDLPPRDSARFQIGQASQETRDSAMCAAIGQFMTGRKIEIDPVLKPSGATDAHAAAARSLDDPEFPPIVLGKQSEDPLADLEKEVALLTERLGGVELPEADALIKKADDYAKAAQAAVSCLLRR